MFYRTIVLARYIVKNTLNIFLMKNDGDDDDDFYYTLRN